MGESWWNSKLVLIIGRQHSAIPFFVGMGSDGCTLLRQKLTKDNADGTDLC